MDLKSDKKISLKQLNEMMLKASPDELAYLLNTYCGPHKVILREKVFEHEAAKKITYLISMKIAEKALEDIILSE